MGNCLRRYLDRGYDTVHDTNNTSQNAADSDTGQSEDGIYTQQSMPDSFNVGEPGGTRDIDQNEIAIDVADGQDIGDGTASAGQDVLDGLPPIDNIEEYPFLSNTETIRFLKKSQTIFIMRGVAGSGKSVLVEHIKRTYPGAVVCSADHFFYDRTGAYRFDQSWLPDAHQACQEKATRSCEDGRRVVIIDNTNIKPWEMSHYLRLAQNLHHYHVMVVEPNTLWKHNPTELAKRNSHNVDLEIITRKVESLKNTKICPVYYAWFLKKDDSTMLFELAKNCMREGIAFIQDNNTRKDLEDMLRQVEANSMYMKPKSHLHCTATYTGGNTSDPYHTRTDVTRAMGRVFSLQVESFVFSHRAIGARINLDAAELNLYTKEEELQLQQQYGRQEVDSDWLETGSGSRDFANGHSNSGKQSALMNSRFKHGCSAHITITFADGSQAKVTGDEVLNICAAEFQGHVTHMGTSSGVLCCYGDNLYQFIPRDSVIVDTIFHGYYAARR